MQDKFNDDMIEQLIKYIDEELDSTERETMEKVLQNNTELQQRYQQLLIAKRAIRSQGLRQRVQAIHHEHMRETPPAKKESAKIIKPTSFFKIFMRVAAVFFIAVAGYGIFLYSSTTDQSEYDNNFVAYHAIINRGDETINNLAASYNAGNYNDAIKIFDSIQNKNQQDYFIAGQSYLKLDNTAAAINAFKAVENLNNNNSEKYFEQETDYYLLLAYIKSGAINQAEQQLDKITSNKQHLFYNKGNEISRTKLKILKWKNK